MDFSEDEFNKKALDLFKISEVLNDNWKINEIDEKFYLSKTKTISVKSSQRPPADNLTDDNDDASDDDPCIAVVKDRGNLILIEYHVLFHPSYQVPVLYFNAYSDGSLISLSRVSDIFVDDFEFQNHRNEMQNVITQAEHPIIFKPFFLLHPCKVHQILSIFRETKNFVLTFLTLFGPSIQLTMNPDYQKFYAN